MNIIDNKRLLCDALQAQHMPADMSQAPALMLARLMGHSSAVHWADKKPIDNPRVTWKTFRQRELAKLDDVDGADDEIERRWASLKAAIIKPTDLEVGHGNVAELKDQILSDGWKCILDDKAAKWYRKVTVTEESPAKKAANAAEMRMETFATVPKPLQSTDGGSSHELPHMHTAPDVPVNPCDYPADVPSSKRPKLSSTTSVPPKGEITLVAQSAGKKTAAPVQAAAPGADDTKRAKQQTSEEKVAEEKKVEERIKEKAAEEEPTEETPAEEAAAEGEATAEEVADESRNNVES